MARECGTCSACCRWPAVPEIDKPARTPCRFLGKSGHGCTIYPDRPAMCAAYQCSWLRGVGGEEDQPFRCDVLIDRRMTQWGLVLVAKPLKPGAATSPEGRGAISQTAREDNLLCLIVDYEDNDRVIGAAGPRVLVDEFKRESGQAPVDVGSPKDFVRYLKRRAREGRWPVI